MAPTPISVVEAPEATPQAYVVSGGRQLAIRSAQARFNGENADGAWRPALAIYAPGGVLLSRTWPSGVMQEGDACDVTFAPALEATAGTGELVATRSAIWDEGSPNPGTIVNDPCTIVGYVFDTTGRPASCRAWLYDATGDNEDNGICAIPGPGGRGANLKLPRVCRNGVTVRVEDSLTGAVVGSGAPVKLSVLYTGQIS